MKHFFFFYRQPASFPTRLPKTYLTNDLLLTTYYRWFATVLIRFPKFDDFTIFQTIPRGFGIELRVQNRLNVLTIKISE